MDSDTMGTVGLETIYVPEYVLEQHPDVIVDHYRSMSTPAVRDLFVKDGEQNCTDMIVFGLDPDNCPLAGVVCDAALGTITNPSAAGCGDDKYDYHCYRNKPSWTSLLNIPHASTGDTTPRSACR